MTEWKGFELSLFDKLRSRWNAALFRLRNRVGFRRGGYSEPALSREQQEEWTALLSADERARLAHYESLLGETTQVLSLASQRRAWSTFDFLHAIPEEIWTNWQKKLPSPHARLLDAGCQDFSRAPAIQAFFRERGLDPQLTGIEVDAFGLLGSMHSRADRADFFARVSGGARFQSQDFFALRAPKPFDAIFCFYPFVSPHPALSWGLPYEYGDAGKWIKSVERNLSPSGLAIVVHQGPWEEEEFQSALNSEKSKLSRVFGAEFHEIFEPHEHPSRIGVYSSEA